LDFCFESADVKSSQPEPTSIATTATITDTTATAAAERHLC
jgi:hypothetical protein